MEDSLHMAPPWLSLLACSCLALVFTFSALATPADADRLIAPFVELSDDDLERIDLHDGYVDDWLAVVGQPVLTGRDAFTGQGYSWFPHYEPADYDFRIWLAWHDATNRLYVAVERVDDVYENTFQRSATGCERRLGAHDGSVHLMVDGDRSGGPLLLYSRGDLTEREAKLLENRNGQAYDVLAETHDSGSHIAMPYQDIADWVVHPPYAYGDGRDFGQSPTVSILEFFFTPFDRLLLDDPDNSAITDLFPGKTIGIGIVIKDRDDGQTRLYGFAKAATELDLGILPHGIMVGKTHAGSGLDQLPEATWAIVKEATASLDTSATAQD